MKKDLSAAEAARILNVSVATLYTYVSRGLLTSVSNGTTRSKRYPYEDVLRLAARNGDARRGGQSAVSAMNWGLPVLETHISHIAEGRLFYRGYDATVLAEQATLEETACLLWHDSLRIDFTDNCVPELPEGLLQQAFALAPEATPLARAMAIFPMLAAALPAGEEGEDAMLQSGPKLMRLLAAILLKTAPSALPLHKQVAYAWGADAAQAELIRAVLVLLADHELNASTFAVRCVASTGARLPAIMGVGLAALSGAKHGGGSEAARRMLVSALASPTPEDVIAAFYSENTPELAGLGHPLYPAGDPRAVFLLERLSAMAPTSSQQAAILSACATASNLLRMRPNCDLALAAMELAYGWPDAAGSTLFALSRSVGWIAHAAEQAAASTLIRPRARYIGSHR